MRAVRMLACALLLVGVVPAPSARAVVEPTPAAPRILLVGDSVTHGSAGDWTWRYRLWRHFADHGLAVDLVGNRQDLWDNVADRPGSLDYVDPDFDRDHEARWGMQAQAPDVPLGALVEEHQPDAVVIMLGVNDLLFGGATPAAVAGRLGELVAEARSVDADVDVVLAETTQTWFGGVPKLNSLLPTVAEDAPGTGQVAIARAAAGYDRDADTWDTSHPNARGEVKIAAAVADALAELGYGPPAQRPLPAVRVGPRIGARLQASAGDGSVTLTWTGPPGATAQVVWGRDATAGEKWVRFPFPVAGGSFTARHLTNGHRYQYRLQPRKGDDDPEGKVFSNVVTATPFRPPTAPRRVRGETGRRCASLTWRRPEFATRFTVDRRTASGWRALGATRRTRFEAERLPRNRAWRFRVRAWHRDVPGGTTRIRVTRSSGGCA